MEITTEFLQMLLDRLQDEVAQGHREKVFKDAQVAYLSRKNAELEEIIERLENEAESAKNEREGQKLTEPEPVAEKCVENNGSCING